ncbi:hypothetical protein BKA81DRAFT_380991 [Phyllosticta paracitricarpa]|uniref:BZIP domain-containing protein n=1 Tax=Phyllosticta citricarpa TaxID=55181 RepID=A0ABR1LDG2_9PEZI
MHAASAPIGEIGAAAMAGTHGELTCDWICSGWGQQYEDEGFPSFSLRQPPSGPVNSPALRSFSSSHPATTSTPKSFTTASNQQQWLPSPAPPALRQPTQQQSQPNFQLPKEDFQLFEQSTPANQPRRPSAPLQPPTFNGHRFYANSAPASTIGFRRHTSSAHKRPPVPLFSSTTGNIPQKSINTVNMVSGNSHLLPLHKSVSHSTPDNGINVAFDGVGNMSLDSFDWTAFSSANYTSVNDPMSASIGTATTVSPKDIFNDPLSSAPPSTAFTNLTSPSINESPYLGDSYDTSPLFQQEGDMSSADGWYPLFPSDEKTACDSAPVDNAPALEEQTGATPLESPQPLVMDTYVRRKSDSKSNSPAAMTHSSVSGVVKSRRRKGPLPPITVQDPSDKVAIKRARNTLAARESRARKYEHVQTLEKRIAELESDKKALADDVEKWKNIALSSGYTPS